ncbi:uncharacterized protein K02A2.6-like [Sycon ciliatum]|uniref:uncharacterized protein K02A2.6-like n=1 Tax=Sycon ciliatum TaxID=27933 RepID=UPI0031F6A05A
MATSHDSLLQDLPGVKCMIDDIIVTGRTPEDHLNTLMKVLQRLAYAGLKLNLAKCHFFQPKVEYCDHAISAQGLHTMPSKVDAIVMLHRRRTCRKYAVFWGSSPTITDHQPLVSIFHPRKGLPAMTVARLQCYAMFLAGHDYTIMYRQADKHCNADGLSRLPVGNPPAPDTAEKAVNMFYMDQCEPLPVTVEQIKEATASDPLLPEVHRYVLQGWPKSGPRAELQQYFQRRNELSVSNECLLWGNRVIIPPDHRKAVLTELHEGHPGMVRMKALAEKHPLVAGLGRRHSRRSQSMPRMPKCPERTCCSTSAPMEHATSGEIARHKFAEFLASNGIAHRRSAPYHPATNGQDERFVQTFKRAIQAVPLSTPAQIAADRFLMSYRRGVHPATNATPAKLFLGRQLRSCLDLLRPSTAQQNAKTPTEEPAGKARSFEVGGAVLAPDYRNANHPGWIPATIVEKLGSRTYMIVTSQGAQWKRHPDQLRAGHPSFLVDEPTRSVAAPCLPPAQHPIAAEAPEPEPAAVPQQHEADATEASPTPTLRRSLRTRKPVSRLGL